MAPLTRVSRVETRLEFLPPAEALAHPRHPPLSTLGLAKLLNLSQTFIRQDIHAGELRAVLLSHGNRGTYRILPAEALRYGRQLGLLP